MKTKIKNYVCAVIKCQNLYLILRPYKESNLPLTGFFFPGCAVEKQRVPMDILLVGQMKEKYNIDIKITSYMGCSIVKTPLCEIHLYAYYCQFIKTPRLNRDLLDYRFVTLSELGNYYLEDNDKIIAERLKHFHRVYDLELPLTRRDLKESKEIWFYIDSLSYFKKRLVKKDYDDLLQLFYLDASLLEIRDAYKWTLRQNDLDYNEYLNHVDYINMMRKKHGD